MAQQQPGGALNNMLGDRGRLGSGLQPQLAVGSNAPGNQLQVRIPTDQNPTSNPTQEGTFMTFGCRIGKPHGRIHGSWVLGIGPAHCVDVATGHMPRT